jgi:hypothetical protein
MKAAGLSGVGGGRKGGRGCKDIEQYLTSRAYLVALFFAVVGVLSVFYVIEAVLPQHWVVYTFLRLMFVAGLAAVGWKVYEFTGRGEVVRSEEAQQQYEASQEDIRRKMIEDAKRAEEELLAEEREAEEARKAEVEKALLSKRTKGGK